MGKSRGSTFINGDRVEIKVPESRGFGLYEYTTLEGVILEVYPNGVWIATADQRKFFFPESQVIRLEGTKKVKPSLTEKRLRARLKEIEKIVHANRGEVDPSFEVQWNIGYEAGQRDMARKIRQVLHAPMFLPSEDLEKDPRVPVVAKAIAGVESRAGKIASETPSASDYLEAIKVVAALDEEG